MARYLITRLMGMVCVLFLVSLGFSVYSVVLALISSVYIHSYCIMCIAGYALNFSLLYLSWLVHRRFSPVSMWAGLKADVRFYLYYNKKSFGILAATVVSAGLLVAFFPAYWHLSAASLERSLPNGVTAEATSAGT